MKIVMCILIADFITGLIHWVEDTYGTPSWISPLDSQVVLPNIEHHRNPSLIGTMSSFISRNYVSVTSFLIIGGIAYLVGVTPYFFLVGILAAFGNEVHTWNHRRNNPWIVRFLQDAGLVQSRHQHNLHHKPPYDKYYCTLTNFTNALLELINFWRTLEYLLDKIGIKVKRGSEERGGF